MLTMNVNMDKRANDISPLLYGVFLEDINYGVDGGLYAELIPNRAFEYYDRNGVIDKHKMCWEEIIGTSFEIKTDRPLNDVNIHYASVSGKAGCGIRNTGYCRGGFMSQKGKVFRFSCYARSEEPTRVNISIADIDGKVFASEDFVVTGSEWEKYTFELTTDTECMESFLTLTLADGGSADFDFISLFPKDTFKGRENGMREDIAQMIADLHPSFMRFPGGCIVEGRSFENMYNWKDTIGPIEKRRTNFNRWQMDEYQREGRKSDDYFQSYGAGFYEYFQFCEDIGAKPVPVVNCGMTCQWHEGLLVDIDRLNPFIQDVLDLIEFANGGEETEWGKKRAEMGHKEPFNLEYIGIGNEQWGNEYFERYAEFEKVLSKEHPEIKLITSAGWDSTGHEFDLAYDWMYDNKKKAYAVDEHFYKEPIWFILRSKRYDNYDRSMPKVFIGEYAAHTAKDVKDRRNNWKAALAEAGFLVNVERNADHVVMTSYAPLLAKEFHQQWQPNLIWFDNKSVYGTPSYYVQQMFNQHLAEYNVEYSFDENPDDLSIYAAVGIKGNKLIVKIVNLSDKKKDLKIETGESFSRIVYSDLVVDLDDENSMKEPYRVSINIHGADEPEFRIRPYSATVIEMERK